MTKKRFHYWVDEDGEDYILDRHHEFEMVDLCMPCGKQVTNMLNELEKEKEYWKDKALHKELIQTNKKYYEVWFYQENGFASTSYPIKSFKNKEKAIEYAERMEKEDKDALYRVCEREFDD